MRVLFLFTSFILQQECFAQQDNSLSERSSRQNVNDISGTIFKYPQFTDGKIIRKDGSFSRDKLNYSRVLGKILFVDRLGKSADLENPETIDKVIIGSDTFCIYNNSFLEKVTHFPKVNLYIKETIVYIEKDKSNSSGSPVIITDDSKSPYSNENTKQDEGINKSSLFKFIIDYFFEDSAGNFSAAGKKNLYDLFPNNKQEMKNYFHYHSVSFNKREEMKDLLQYLNGL